MVIKKINSNETLEINIKTIRLPKGDGVFGITEEIDEIFKHSFLNDVLETAMYIEFSDDEDFVSEYYGDPISGINLIPIIELNNKVEPDTYYIVNGLPFYSISETCIVCSTRLAYIQEDFGILPTLDEIKEFINQEFDEFIS